MNNDEHATDRACCWLYACIKPLMGWFIWNPAIIYICSQVNLPGTTTLLILLSSSGRMTLDNTQNVKYSLNTITPSNPCVLLRFAHNQSVSSSLIHSMKHFTLIHMQMSHLSSSWYYIFLVSLMQTDELEWSISGQCESTYAQISE